MNLHRLSWAASAALVLVACGDSGSRGDTAGMTDGGSSTNTTPASTSTGQGGSATDSATSEPGSGSDSMTSQTATEPTTTATTQTSNTGSTGEPGTTTDPGSTGNASNSSEGTTSGGSTTGETVGDTTGAIDSTGEMSGGSSTTGPNCMPVQETCNDLDDDCNGIIDDVDVGGDGFCDCLNIAIFGNKGANPSSQFETWLQMQGTKVDRIQMDNTPLTKALLDNYDIILLDWLVRPYTAQEATLVQEWVGTGGGLMSLTGHTNNNTVVDRPNSLIQPMGLSYNASAGFFSGPVTQWTKPHPITDMVNNVPFYGGLYINIVNDGVGMNQVIGTLQPGPVAVAQVRKGGKLFIFGDEWIEFDSQWQNQPEIKKFWANILGWLSPQNFCTVPQ